MIMRHGERVVSRLLDALQADGRFVSLAGRWYLREFATPLSEEQISALAWAMLEQSEPLPTEALVPFIRPPLPAGDDGLFGLLLSLRDHPDLFANTAPDGQPCWELAGPPPGSFTPRNAAYDPDTYEVLCLPEQPVPPDVVKRLWQGDLLRAVV